MAVSLDAIGPAGGGGAASTVATISWTHLLNGASCTILITRSGGSGTIDLLGGSLSFNGVGSLGTPVLNPSSGSVTSLNNVITSNVGDMPVSVGAAGQGFTGFNQTLDVRETVNTLSGAGNMQGGHAAGASSVTFTHTLGAADFIGAAGVNLLAGVGVVVLAWVAVGPRSAGDGGVTTAAKFNGQTMTSQGVVHTGGGTAGYIELFAILNPVVGGPDWITVNPGPVLKKLLRHPQVYDTPVTVAGTAWTQTNTDDTGLTDSVVFDQNKSTVDSTGLTDTFKFDQEKPTTDDTGLTDTSIVSVGRGLADPLDSVGLTDTSVVSQGFGVTQTDSVGLTDTNAISQGYGISQTDSVGLTDVNKFDQSKVFTDDTGLTDSVVIEHGIVISQTDDTGLTDSATEQLNATGTSWTVTVTDSAGLTDISQFDQTKPTTDSTGLTDTNVISIGRGLADPLDSTGLTDTFKLDQTKVTTNDTGLTDTTKFDQSKPTTDSTGLTDTSAISQGFGLASTDSTGLTDPVVFAQGKGPVDSVGLTDTVVFTMTHVLSIMDSTGLTDTSIVSGGTHITYRIEFGEFKPRIQTNGPKSRIHTGQLKSRIGIGAPKL